VKARKAVFRGGDTVWTDAGYILKKKGLGISQIQHKGSGLNGAFKIPGTVRDKRKERILR